MSTEQENKTALVIMAHPDDAEFGSAGTTLTWVQDGWDVHYVICTDASGGGLDEATDVGREARRAISEVRKQEQRAAGDILGLKEIVFLDYPDGLLEPSLELRRDLVRMLRTYRPSRVICPCPDRVWTPNYFIQRHHPDHLAVGQAALAAIYPASQNPWDFPELLEEGLFPHKVSEVYVTGAPVINHAVDITETFETKLKALQAHESQVSANWERLEEMMRKGAQKLGEQHGFTYAEEFHLFKNW